MVLQFNLFEMKIKISILIVFAMLSSISLSLKAQLNPFQAQYYTNRYLGNAAMAGIDKGLTLGAIYRSQFNNFPGAPISQNFTANYGYNKVGIGLNVTNEKAGLQRFTRALASYAYHLKLNDASTMHFGISAGVVNQRLESGDVVGNSNDNLVGLYNQRPTHFDGDFGLALTTERFSVEVALPNLRNLLWQSNGNIANLPTYYSAISYKIPIQDAELEPKLVYRGIKGYDNIWDAGAQLSLIQKQVQLNGIYHSSGNASFGIGMDYQNKYLITLSHTTQINTLSNYSNGDFELNLRVKF